MQYGISKESRVHTEEKDYYFSKNPTVIEHLAPQLRLFKDMNKQSLNVLTSLIQKDAKVRTVKAVSVGYSIQKNGQDLQTYEYDSKSFNNSYSAFMVRHNSNKLEPDPIVVDRLSLLAR